MLVKDLLEYLQDLPEETLNKELTFYDYANSKVYETPSVPTVVDESDEYALDLVFNYDEEA